MARTELLHEPALLVATHQHVYADDHHQRQRDAREPYAHPDAAAVHS